MQLQHLAGTVITLSTLFFVTSISNAQTNDGLITEFTRFTGWALSREMVPQVFEYEFHTKGKDTTTKICSAIVKKKDKKYLLEFTAPGDLKGTRFLNLDTNQNYVYLPAFGKVRRITTGVTNPTFFGMAISAVDLILIAHMGDYYDAVKFIHSNPLLTEMELQPKPGVNAPYAKINIGIALMGMAQYIDCFDASGQKIKTMRYNSYTCELDICTATEWVVTDLINNSETKLISKSRKINVQMGDETFSKSNLDK